MIVARVDVGTGGAHVDPEGPAVSWVCLARRGMLRSDCDGIEHFRLQPGARLPEKSAECLGDVWFVVRGHGVLDDGRSLTERALFVRGPGARPGLTATTGMEVLAVSVRLDGDGAAPQLPGLGALRLLRPSAPRDSAAPWER